MKATIDDVARRAAVSAATVSRALRGLPSVAPATRERVLAAARELAYIGDPSASRLAGGPTRTIGLAVPSLGQWYYSRLFAGVEAAASAAGYDVLPFSTGGPGGIERFLERLPFHKRVDGLAIVDIPTDEARCERLLGSGIPVIALGTASETLPSILIDNVAAARLGVCHLTRLGHRRIAMIGGVPPDAAERVSSMEERFAGYASALEAAGLEVDPRLVIGRPVTLEGGAEAMHALLALEQPPTAVFACTDEMAMGALQTVNNAGLRAPTDVSVLGFDDHDVAEYVGLTTIRQDVVGQGHQVVARLLQEFAERGSGDVVVVHPTRLMVRQTTAPPRTGGDAD